MTFKANCKRYNIYCSVVLRFLDCFVTASLLLLYFFFTASLLQGALQEVEKDRSLLTNAIHVPAVIHAAKQSETKCVDNTADISGDPRVVGVFPSAADARLDAPASPYVFLMSLRMCAGASAYVS